MKQGFGYGVVLAALLGLTACHAPAADPAGASAAMQLQIYPVPPAQTGRLAEALGNALGGKASVTVPAPGTLLVYAPRDTQTSIGAALNRLSQATPAPSADGQATVPQVALHFWVVDAQAGTGADDPALRSLSATFESLRKQFGALHFQLDQTATAAVAGNRHGRITIASPQGFQRTFNFELGAAAPSGVELSLDYQDTGPGGLRQLSTEVGARYGDYVVLAQAPDPCAGASATPASACVGGAALRLLIVRVDRLQPHA